MTDYWGQWVVALEQGKGTLPELMHNVLREIEPAWSREPADRKPDWPRLHALDFRGVDGAQVGTAHRGRVFSK